MRIWHALFKLLKTVHDWGERQHHLQPDGLLTINYLDTSVKGFHGLRFYLYPRGIETL